MNSYHLIPRIIEKTCHGCRYWEHGPFTATKSGTASITAHGVDVQNPDIAPRTLALELSLARLTPVPNKNPGIRPICCIPIFSFILKNMFPIIATSRILWLAKSDMYISTLFILRTLIQTPSLRSCANWATPCNAWWRPSHRQPQPLTARFAAARPGRCSAMLRMGYGWSPKKGRSSECLFWQIWQWWMPNGWWNWGDHNRLYNVKSGLVTPADPEDPQGFQ